MADNKSRRLDALTLHCLTYALVLASGLILTGKFSYHPVALFAITNLAFHWTTDFFTSRATARAWAGGRTKEFFSIIGLDQFCHNATLILTTKFFFGAI